MNTVHYSRKRDDWETPVCIFNPLDAEFDFDLDPCADVQNRKCQLYFSKDKDGLIQPWAELGYKCAFVNPPYSQLKKWVAKCAIESRNGMTCVMLIPSRTDTKAWHAHIYDSKIWRFRPGVEARFYPGRIHFVGGEYPAPFPSCVVIFRPV